MEMESGRNQQASKEKCCARKQQAEKARTIENSELSA
jgi:hypothetical protein